MERKDIMPTKLLNIEETSRLLNVSTMTVRRMIADKDIKAFKVKNQWRIDEREIIKYLENNTN